MEPFPMTSGFQEAGIENFNVVYYPPVLLPESYEILLSEAKKYFHHGGVLESIMAKACGVQGDTVAA